MNTNNEIRIVAALESIAISLNTLAEDAKANRVLREGNKEMLGQLEASIKNLRDDPFNLIISTGGK